MTRNSQNSRPAETDPYVHTSLVVNNNDHLQVPNSACPRGRGEGVLGVGRALPLAAWASHYAKVDDEHEQDGQVGDDNEADVDDNYHAKIRALPLVVWANHYAKVDNDG